jgi:hypothetical protein
MAIEAEIGARCGGLAAIVRLDARAPHEHVSALRQGVGQQKFIVAGFVSAKRQPAAIIPLDKNGWTAKSLGKPRQPLERRRQVGQPNTGQPFDPVTDVLRAK